MGGVLKEIRKRIRSRRQRGKLLDEEAFYAGRFASQGLSIPGRADIRRILRGRFPGLAAVPKGRLRTLAIYHHYNWEEEALRPSLETFGPVTRYDWGAGFDRTSRDWIPTIRDRMNSDLLNRAAAWMAGAPFHVIFTYLSGEQVTPQAMEKLRAFKVPIVNLSLNDKEHFVGKIRGGQAMGMRDICRFFDLCWTSTEDALKKYCAEGALPLYLPEGANPDVHRPFDVERKFDVSFVGQCYGNRPAIVERLKQAGIRVEAFGFGWPNGPLTTEEMVKMYSRSRINLGFGGVAGHDDTFCLKGRDFEIPMSGGLYVTESCAELEKFFRPGGEVITYEGFDDLVAKIRYLLAHPEEAEQIRRAGFERARSEHTWEMRLEKVFRLMGVTENSSGRNDTRKDNF